MAKLLLASIVLATAGAVLSGVGSPPSMTDAARGFLSALDTAQRAKAVLPIDSQNRTDWHYIPRERQGLSLKEMSPVERDAALLILRAGLSEGGYQKAETIRQLENVLREIEGRAIRDPELYFFTIFGEPSDTGIWGFRYEGHHVSQNWTFVDGKAVSESPQFFGANPAEVRSGPLKGTRALSSEEDMGRALAKSLDPNQRREGLLEGEAPRDIVTGNQRRAMIQEDRGIPYGHLSAEQHKMLSALIDEYARTLEPSQSEARLAKVERAGLDGVKFYWMGGLEKGQGHYYRIQGKTFLIEYDNTQNQANHIHTVWRDFDGDFGLDLLGAHYKTSAHHAREK